MKRFLRRLAYLLFGYGKCPDCGHQQGWRRCAASINDRNQVTHWRWYRYCGNCDGN